MGAWLAEGATVPMESLPRSAAQLAAAPSSEDRGLGASVWFFDPEQVVAVGASRIYYSVSTDGTRYVPTGSSANSLAGASDVSSIDLPTVNGPLAAALAALAEQSGTSTIAGATDVETVDLPTVNEPLAAALAALGVTHAVEITAGMLVAGIYTLSAASTDTLFWTQVTNAIVLVPELATPILPLFLPPATGSITIRKAGAVRLNGASLDIVRTRATDPYGFALMPNFGTANAYLVSSGTTSWSQLLGSWRDVASLVTAVDACALASTIPVAVDNAGTVALTTTPLVLDPSLHAGRLLANGNTSNRVVQIALGALPADFRCRLANLSSAAINIQAASGVTVYGPLHLGDSPQIAELRAISQDVFYVWTPPDWGTLTGVWSDNASLAGAIPALVDNAGPLALVPGTPLVLDPTHQGKLVSSAATSNTIVQIAAGTLPTNFRCRIANFGTASVQLQGGTGVTILSKANGKRLPTQNTVAHLVCTGVQDTFYYEGADVAV